MAVVNLVNGVESVITGNDNIVIVDNFQSVRGGRTLDVTGYPYGVLNAGHVIIKSDTGEYKPMPITGEGSILSVGTLTAGSSYVAGTYNNVALTGGTGSGAKATIVVGVGGGVTSVVVTTDGKGYAVADELSAANANLGGAGTGFKIVVASVSDVKDEYASLPANHTYEGILISSINIAKPFAGIMLRGTVNTNASPFPLATILSALKTACPLISFV